MYKIIGGDQKEYGPVTFEQLAEWIRDNRANAQTLVAKEGGPWVPLGSLPEFAVLLPAPAAGPGPEPSAVSAASGPELPTFASPLASDTRERARQMVQGPATGLLVTGILCVVFALMGIAGNLFGTSFRPPPGDIPEEMRPLFDMMQQMQGPAAVVSSVIGLLISALIIFAAQKMRALQSFALVVTATILAMVPCTSPCCCIGLPIGIWVLVVLFKPEVKAAFE